MFSTTFFICDMTSEFVQRMYYETFISEDGTFEREVHFLNIMEADGVIPF